MEGEVTGDGTQAAIRLVMDALADRGWPDRHGVALAVVNSVLADPSALTTGDELQRSIPRGYLIANRIKASAVVAAIRDHDDELLRLVRPVVLDALPAIIQVDDIDTFAQVRSVTSPDVAAYATPFDVPEDYIKRMVAEIVGEPFVQKDWGGEFDDLFSGQLQLNGRRVTTTFMFKGRGLKGRMRPRDLGKNGDQIDRLLLQPAELFVVQHVHKIEASVRRELQRGIVARRAEGHPAVGTVWDGADTARLAAAHGYLDLSTGALRPLSSS